MKTIVYIDSFNLYYRALKGTPYKWLNIKLLAESLWAAQHQIVGVKYYTARVSGRADPDAPRRQSIYLRALQTVPEISIYFGSFLFKQNWRRAVNTGAQIPAWRPPIAHLPQGLSRYEPLTNPIPGELVAVEIYETEENGSDVNLASHLIHDAWSGRFESAAVLTNDTDLIEPIRIVRHEVGKPVGPSLPHGKPCPKSASGSKLHQEHPQQALGAEPIPEHPCWWNYRQASGVVKMGHLISPIHTKTFPRQRRGIWRRTTQ